MTIETSKYLGGIGAILMLVGLFPYISFYGIVELVGIILIMAALYGFAGFFKDRGIFNYALYGILIAIIGIIIAAVLAVIIVLPNITPFITTLYPSWDGQLSSIPSLSSMTPNTNAINFADVVPFITAALVALVVGWIFAIISAFFFRRSFKLMSAKTTTGLFSAAGLLLLIGAILLILAIVPGVVLMWVAVLLLAIAFFTMRPVQPTENMPPAPAVGTV